MSIVDFWVVTSCGLVGGYECFAGMYRLHLHGDRTSAIKHRILYSKNEMFKIHAYLTFAGAVSLPAKKMASRWIGEI
jgi:hypothetical protein